MARRSIRCGNDEKRFTVIRVNGDQYDTHAARSFESALDLALPDHGAKVEVFTVCAKDAGEARMPFAYQKRGQLLRSFRFKGRGQ